jgi:hypothetical protein
MIVRLRVGWAYVLSSIKIKLDQVPLTSLMKERVNLVVSIVRKGRG